MEERIMSRFGEIMVMGLIQIIDTHPGRCLEGKGEPRFMSCSAGNIVSS